MKRILGVGTSTGGGDVPPLVATLSGLKRVGHEVKCTGDLELAAMAGAELDVVSFKGLSDLSVYRRAWEAKVESSTNRDLRRLFQLEWMDDLLPHMRDLVSSFRPDILVCTGFTLCVAATLRREFDLPLCWVNSSFYFGPHGERPYVADFIPERSVYVEGALPYYAETDLVIHSTDPEFDPPPANIPPHHFWVGPLLWEAKGRAPPYLYDSGDPWILATLSTYRQEGELGLARAVAGAMRGLANRALITLGRSDSREAVWPRPHSVHIEGFAPHCLILPKAALSISHGGYGIVSKSMYHGVPMVLVPWGRDQRGVARRAEAAGVACVIDKEKLTERTMREAILKVLGSRTMKEQARVRREYLRGLDSIGEAVRRIELTAN